MNAAIINYGRTLINLDFPKCSVTSDNIAKIAEGFLLLKKLTITHIRNHRSDEIIDEEDHDYDPYDEPDVLSLSDMEAIASLPSLKYLKLDGYFLPWLNVDR